MESSVLIGSSLQSLLTPDPDEKSLVDVLAGLLLIEVEELLVVVEVALADVDGLFLSGSPSCSF